MSQPYDTQGAKHASFFPRRRAGTIYSLVIVLIVLFLFFRSSSVSPPATINELYGLLYMVSKTENTLSHNLDISGPVAPSTWVPGEPFDPKLWKERMTTLHEQTPVIVFSKASTIFGPKLSCVKSFDLVELLPVGHPAYMNYDAMPYQGY